MGGRSGKAAYDGIFDEMLRRNNVKRKQNSRDRGQIK